MKTTIKPFGLTGNIGCGKSTVAKLLGEYPDVAIYDTDKIAKAVIEAEENRTEVIRILGDLAFDGGRVDFKAIAGVIFTQIEKKNALEKLVFPQVWQIVEGQIVESKARLMHVVESAIIYETSAENRFSQIVVASCDESEQRRRLRENRQMEDNAIDERLAVQFDPLQKEQSADYVVRTNCSMEQLRNRVAQLYFLLQGGLDKSIETKVRKAVYAGTFDPPTLGHLWMIEQAAELFDEVVVAIGINPDKKALFSISERLKMLEEMSDA